MVSISDLCLIIFVLVDDFLKEKISNGLKREGIVSLVSDAEILTMFLVQGMLGIESDAKWLRLLNQYYRGEFPFIPERSRYQRRRLILAEHKDTLIEFLEKRLPNEVDNFVADSCPLRVCHNVRAGRNKKLRGLAKFGYCASKKEYFYGFKVHLLMNTVGLLKDWTILPANRHDRVGLSKILEGKSNLTVYGDKAYQFKQACRERFTKRQVQIIGEPRSNMNKQLTPAQKVQLGFLRQRIENGISALAGSCGLEKTLGKTFHNITARSDFKLLGFNFRIYLNYEYQRPCFEMYRIAA